MLIQLSFVTFSNLVLENEEAFETAKEAKNPNQNFDYSLLQSLTLISVLLNSLCTAYNILLTIYFHVSERNDLTVIRRLPWDLILTNFDHAMFPSSSFPVKLISKVNFCEQYPLEFQVKERKPVPGRK